MSSNLYRVVGIVSVSAWWLALAGCVDTPSMGSLVAQPSVAQLQAARGIRATYIYYPDYEVYYSQNYQQYVFPHNDGWMTQSTPPPGVPAAALQAAKRIPMDFNDDPSLHHAEIIRTFPRYAMTGNTEP